MTLSLRLLAAGLLLATSFSASAQDSSLDRLSGTEAVLGSSGSSVGTDAPTAGRVCNGVETGSSAPCPPPDAPPVPLDGGLSLLALAGAGYAAKRLRARRA